MTERVRGLMPAPAVDLAGRTDIPTLGAILERCALFVGNDSGPTHLAAAVGIPVVAIFGPTDPRIYAPYSPRAIALHGPMGTGIEEVGMNEVLRAIERLLDMERSGRGPTTEVDTRKRVPETTGTKVPSPHRA